MQYTKYTDPTELFKIIVKTDLRVIIDNQKLISIAQEVLEKDKPYCKLLKIAIDNDVYKELLKPINENSKTKIFHIEKAIKILTEECFIIKEKAIWAVGWLASIIYPIEWFSLINKSKPNEEKDNIWNLPNLINSKPSNDAPVNKPQTTTTITTKQDNYSLDNVKSNELLDNKDWTLEEIDLEMIYCPAGNFMMGCPDDEIGNNKKEEILHKVIISKAFRIGKYPVTQKQYQAIMGCNPSFFEGSNNPVESVSWEDTKKFCKILNSKYKASIPQGYEFALPTEAQWEYACRAGTTTALNNGSNLSSDSGYCKSLDEIAWYIYNTNQSTHPVGKKKPNKWGIYDFHGNVWEWCSDFYGDYPSYTVTDPTGPNYGELRVFRGGCFRSYPGSCRSGYRFFLCPNDTSNDVGFRVALVPTE